MKRNIIIWLGVLSLLLAACGDTAGEGNTTVAGGDGTTAATAAPSGTDDTTATTGGSAEGDGEPITIAASLPLTGMFSVAGVKHQNGYQLCVDLINESGGLLGRPVELLVSDNQSDTETVVSQYERFINVDQAELLLGTFSSLLTVPSATIAEQAQMLYVSPSDGSLVSFSRGFEFLFDIQQSARQLIGKTPVDALLYYQEQGVIPEGDLQTVAVVNADDFFANVITSGLVGDTIEVPGGEPVDLAPGFLVEAGLEITYRETWPADFQDWIGLANRLKEANADALFAQVPAAGDGIELVKGLQVVDYNPKFHYMSVGSSSEFQEQLGEATEGLMVHLAWHPTATLVGVLNDEPFSNSDFIREFEEHFGQPPNEEEAVPFTACQVLEQAVRAVGSTDNVALRDWLASRTADDPARTILGDLYWDERGLVQDRHFLLGQRQDGELEFVFPPEDFEVTPLLYPKPEW